MSVEARGNPVIEIVIDIGESTPFVCGPQDVFKANPSFEKIGNRSVHVAISAVAHHQPIIGIKQDKSIGCAFNSVPQLHARRLNFLGQRIEPYAVGDAVRESAIADTPSRKASQMSLPTAPQT